MYYYYFNFYCISYNNYSNEAVSSSSNSDKQNGSVYVDVNLVGSKAN